jgi:hypothetical protein
MKTISLTDEQISELKLVIEEAVRRIGPPSGYVDYFTSAEEAERVVNKIRSMNERTQERFVWELIVIAYDGDAATAQVRDGRGHSPDVMMKMMFPSPRAVCLAALRAVER